MKKFLTAILSLVVLVSAMFVVGCNKTMYKLTFTAYDGVEYVVDEGIMSGASVSEGYEVKFKVEVAEDYKTTAPIVVKANGTVLNKGGDGKYTITMQADTLISVEGITPVPVASIVFTPASGITYDIDNDIPSGAYVSKGYEVKFSVSVDNGFEGTPIVKSNGNVLTKGNDGKYSVVLNANTNITVEGVYKPTTKSVVFDKGTFRIKYLDPVTKEELSTLNVEPGSTVKFLLDISVYYIQEGYTVTANTEVLEPDADGIYSFEAVNNVTVSVLDLEQDYGFIDRPDGGMGTQENPFKIEKAVDLFYMAELINNDYYAGSAFYGAFYELTADIDMKGEQLFIIGDNTSQTAFFAGDFNGNGHTISNYYIDDEKVDQSTYVSMFLPYIGMFGNVQPLTTRAPRIYDVNLKDFTIEVNAAKYQSTFMVGGLVASGMGVDITAVNVDGTIVADADVGYFGYMGGILGASVSASTTDGQTRYYSVVRASSSSVDISANSGYVYACGGIAGYIGASDEVTSSIILNCYNTGDVSGAMHTGGLVGYVGAYSSVISSYSTGNVVAQSTIASTGIAENDIYTYAYAGGLVGYLDYSTVVTDSFATGNVSAYTVESGRNIAGNVYGKFDEATFFVNSETPIVLNSVGKEVSVDNAYIKNTLGWDTTDWVFNDDGYPVINMETASKTITITIDCGSTVVGGQTSFTRSVKDMYIPMSIWYVQYDEATDGYLLPEYIDADTYGVRSYGYFFDAELTKRVPYSYVPANDVTLYAGFANYGEVAGEYAVQGQNNSLIIKLGLDGTFTYADGASVFVTDYYYNGNYAILRNTPFARLGEYTDETIIAEVMTYFFSFRADKDGDNLKIYDTTYFPIENAFTAVKIDNTFKYGTYYANTNEYAFYKDGTGRVNNSPATYYVEDGVIYVNTASGERTGTVDANGYVTKIGALTLSYYDAYKGVWTATLDVNKTLNFDGKGGVTVDGETATYTLTETGLKIGSDDVFFDGVSLTYKGAKYFVKNSYVGTWKYNNALEPIEITFKGLSLEGIGEAVINYANGSTILDGFYEVINNGKTVEVYVNGVCYASLTLQNNTSLKGEIISTYSSMVKENVVFALQDVYKGVWVSEVTGLEKLEFNGYGLYNIAGTSDYMSVKGQLTVNGKTTKTPYTIDVSSGIGSFTYDSVDYTFTYDFVNNSIKLSAGGNTYDVIGADELFDLTFIGNDGKTYTFDGRGYLVSGGTLKVSDDTTYTYKITNSGITLNNGTITLEKVSGINVYKFNVTGKEDTLTIKNSFTGEYYVSGNDNLGYGLTIGLIEPTKNVAITYKGESLVGAYDGKVISFTLEDQTYYIHAYTGGEVGIGTDLSGYGTNIVCKKTVDAFYGRYQTADGGYIFFDGLGESRYANGVAIEVNADGETVKVYSYEIDKNGNPLMVEVSNEAIVVEYLFVLDADGEYTLSGKTYSIVKIDRLYLAKATDKDGKVYLFDGIGSVSIDGVTKSYRIINQDSINRTITIEISDGTTTQTAVINYVNTQNVTITFTENA
ncbi:MAG: hypothetical protein J6B16_06140 [Clostridia bacterium]|nr:hypothetical protein [Clostridia bacterium]